MITHSYIHCIADQAREMVVMNRKEALEKFN